jgi:DNA phosphorothioation-dependent restriction protein DptG
MKRKTVTLLDRAKGHLSSAKLLLKYGRGDDVEIDVAAHLCQLSVELCAKFLIELEGKSYAPRHESYAYIEDLSDERAVELIESIASRIDNWTSFIRYSKAIKSSVKEIETVINVCEELIELANKKVAANDETISPATCVMNCF